MAEQRARDPKIEIPNFSGDKDECSIREWTFRVDMVQQACNWTNQKTANVAKNRLVSVAFQWLTNQIHNGTDGLDVWQPEPAAAGAAAIANPPTPTPPSLRSLLLNRFDKLQSEQQRVSLRRSLTQKEDEDPHDFLDRVHMVIYQIEREEFPNTFITDEATKEIYRKVHDATCFTHFLSGLLPEIHDVVANQDLKDIKQALKAAEQAHTTIKDKQTGTKTKRNEQMKEETSTDTDATIAAMFRQFQTNTNFKNNGSAQRGRGSFRGNPRRQNQRNGQRSEQTCFYCDKPNHIERDCRSKFFDIKDRKLGRQACEAWKAKQRRQQHNQAGTASAIYEQSNEEENQHWQF